MLTAIEMADKAFVKETSGEEALLVSGQTNLMEYVELADMEKLRHLFEAFREKTDLLHILDQCLRADGLRIFIGEESGLRGARRLQRHHRTVRARRRSARGARGHRPDPHGL